MPRMLCRALAPIAFLACLMGCGRSSSAPSAPVQVNLPAGTYSMTVIASDPSACSPKWSQPFPATLPVALTIEPTAEGWSGRTRSGDLQMSLAAQSGTARIIPVSGTIRGTSVVASGLDGVISLGLRFSGVNDAGSAVMAASTFPPTTAIQGEIRGKTSFLSAQQGTMVCSYVEFTLFRPE